ncbi:protein-glutamate methyltransferase [Caulobacter flavus]|uniref:protein-glutamate O-methyltransferase n=1 Tax=Caulobacter flavus TaxID=1679497 RepID=A0A2N5CVS4_9CAUL|nr:protein-glutamate methyltransferase [Caulobacter flavus]PLR17901.1 protein-glutamate methyltransferase [Caulobacter flavus]
MALAADEPFQRLKRAVIVRTGHHYYADKDDVLWDRVQRRLLATRDRDVSAYLKRLASADDGEAEWAALETEITIGETFFFRYAEQFTALRETILPDIIERKAQDKRIRIWSAGCATGAEPYSIAILLSQMLGEALADWRISILGGDINAAFLETARKGQFGRWALRAVSDADRAQWFTETARNTWTLKPAYRGLVRFERQNLLDLLGPAPPLELTEFDLILCRNVLIYFHHEVVEQLVGALGSRLAADGWLLLGHAEPNPAFGKILDVAQLPGTVAYRPPNPERPAPPGPSFEAFAAPEPEPAQHLHLAETPSPQWRPAPIPTPVPTPAPPAADLVETVRRLADAGDYAAAEAACRAALAVAPEDPALHLHDGLVLRALGRPGPAEAAFKRALYLDRGFVMAHYHLGLLLLDQGRVRAAARSLKTAAQIAGTVAPGARLAHGAGLDADQLRKSVRLLLQSLVGV